MISTAPQRRPPATALVEERAGGRLCSFQRFSSCRRLSAVFDRLRHHENWLEANRYINMDDLKEHKKLMLKAAA